jgi:hypothetical protein
MSHVAQMEELHGGPTFHRGAKGEEDFFSCLSTITYISINTCFIVSSQFHEICVAKSNVHVF